MGNIEIQEVDHSVFDLLNWIRQRPYAFLDGERSLIRIRSLLVGYEFGIARFHHRLGGYELFKSFEQWLATRLGFGEPTSGWWNMVAAKTENQEEGYKLFFELLDRFCEERGISCAK